MNHQESHAEPTIAEGATCPNCTSLVANHPANGCVLAALIQVLRDREELSEERILEIHANCDIDYLWTVVAKVVDHLGAGDFSADEGVDILFDPAARPVVQESVQAIPRLESDFTSSASIHGGILTTESGETVDLALLQATFNDAFRATGTLKYAESANILSALTHKVQGPHGEWSDA